MFTLARSLPDGSTLYRSRAGVRFILRPWYEDGTSRGDRTSLYAEGRFIFFGSRADVLQHMEAIAH